MSKKVKLEPWVNRIMLKRDEAPKEKKHGSIIVGTGKNEVLPNRGEVVAVGPDQKRVKVGWRVVFAAYQCAEVEEDGTTYLIIDEGAIIAVEVSGE